MSFGDILMIAVGLAMDAFAISVCKGLVLPPRSWKKTAVIAGWFSLFQMLMPTLGWLAGSRFSSAVAGVSHWIAFALLALIGGNMIRESFHPDEEKTGADTSFRVMLPLAVATSIDALITGVTFAFLNTSIWFPILVIGLITFALSAAGVLLGRLAGSRLEKYATLTGGIVLILIGLKILLEHLAGPA